jgi:nucleoside-diphosphate-sugar epimerase
VTVLVLGATSLVGSYLLPRLAAAGHAPLAVSRRPPTSPSTLAQWFGIDITRATASLPACPTAIHLAPLWLLPPLVETMAANGLRRIIAFGSTSRFTKERSANAGEREVARRLAESEDVLRETCLRHGIAWTLFRPTLIYGGGRDRNLTAIAGWARRLGFVAVAGKGSGLRQPVHADDLAAACVQALASSVTHGREYDLGGATVLSYRAMAEGVARATGGARVIGVPAPLLRTAFRAASLLPRYRQLTASMVDRMEEDLVVDHSPAQRDFGYAPRAFAYPDGATAAPSDAATPSRE